jgi:IS605 OrfB family transposase
MKISGMKSQIACKARQAAVAAYKAIKENEGKNWRTSIEKPASKHNPSMRLDKRIFRLLPNNQIKISLIGKKMEVFRFKPYGKFSDMMSRHVMLDPLVFERNGEQWLACSFEIPCPTHVPSACVGIDLGQRRLAVTSEGAVFQSKAFLKGKRLIRYNKRMIQARKQNSHSARTKSKSMRRRERNFSKNEMHRLVNNVLSSTAAGVLVIEDLTKIKRTTKHQGRRHNNMLSQVPFCIFKTILTYKARALGKRVETVDPAYTSKDDSRGIAKGVRKGCRYYASDGVQLDADHNAAINIANRWSNKSHLPTSSVAPIRGNQTLWAGRVNRPIVDGRPERAACICKLRDLSPSSS